MENQNRSSLSKGHFLLFFSFHTFLFKRMKTEKKQQQKQQQKTDLEKEIASTFSKEGTQSDEKWEVQMYPLLCQDDAAGWKSLVQRQVGRCLWASGQLDKAALAFRRALSSSSSSSSLLFMVWMELAELYIEQKRFDAAEVCLKGYLEAIEQGEKEKEQNPQLVDFEGMKAGGLLVLGFVYLKWFFSFFFLSFFSFFFSPLFFFFLFSFFFSFLFLSFPLFLKMK